MPRDQRRDTRIRRPSLSFNKVFMKDKCSSSSSLGPGGGIKASKNVPVIIIDS